MSDPKFIHLRLHSDYSMVDGINKIPELVNKVAEFGMPAMALTDFTNLCGLVKFYNIAHSKGIKPIIGADFKMQIAQLGVNTVNLTILAINNVGYKNLISLISKAYLRGHINHQVAIDREWLAEHAQGLIVLSGASEGDIAWALLHNKSELAAEFVQFYKEYFNDRFYLELSRIGKIDEEKYIDLALKLAVEYDLAVVATNQVVFIESKSFEAHEIRVAIYDGYTLEDPSRPQNYTAAQYLRSEKEMCELFADIPEALTNTVEIAKRCNVTVRLGEYFLPAFPTGGMAETEFLVTKSREGLEQRLEFLFPDPLVRRDKRYAYDERLQIELDVINQMGFPGYFLIVMEFIQWSKDHGIPVGPGRGSGAGSLVAYALKITDLDPLEYDLLFERFLNPERVSMPDFDVDFCMDKRDLVIDHVAQMYGRDAVSQIITFGTMAAKAVIRDVGRVLGHPYGFVDRIAKLVPMDLGITLTKALEIEPDLAKLYNQDEEIKELLNICLVLEGCVRNAGKHAGGVVISPSTISDFSPIYADPQGNFPVTQFDKNDVETAGLIKFDFLGLRTLTIIDWALDLIYQTTNKQIQIESIPLDDKQSFISLQNAETTAVFQLESRGMKDLIKRLQPDCFEDIIALVALFRPGPLQSGMVDNFINRKHGREAISYPDEKWQHKSLKDILEPTYGIILYQEQVMQIAQVLAGYTLGGADMLRRAMGKKKPEEMAKQRDVFKAGAIDNNVDGELAMKIFDLVEKFAGYGFNKSHSAAYALVSYQTLWLKTHYPAQFMAAVMSTDMDNTDKIVALIDECLRMQLTILPPDINISFYRFNVDQNSAIIYGLGAIKGVGQAAVEIIIKAREEGGKFYDLFDFCGRIDCKKVGKRVIEKLILSGALDNLGTHRASLMASVDEAIKAANQHHQAQEFGQSDMFGVLAQDNVKVVNTYQQAKPWSEKLRLEGERDTLGVYLSGHPISSYLKELKNYTTYRIIDATPTRRNQRAILAGLVSTTKTITTKRGAKLGILKLDDQSATIEVVVYSQAFEQYWQDISVDQILIISGEISFDDFNGALRMSAHEILTLDLARIKYAKGITIFLDKSQINDKFCIQLADILKKNIGVPAATFTQETTNIKLNNTLPVYINYQNEAAEVMLTLADDWQTQPNDELLDQLASLIGTNKVILKFNQ